VGKQMRGSRIRAHWTAVNGLTILEISADAGARD